MSEPNLSQYVNTEQLREDVKIDITDITGGMVNQTGLYVHYASMTVRAKGQYERWKKAVDVLEARLSSEYRTSLIAEEEDSKGNMKTLRPTEPQILAAIHSDVRWRNANSVMINAQELYRLTEVAERAFDHRKDMLLQIARDAARESSGPLRVAVNQTNQERGQALMKTLGKSPSGTPPWDESPHKM